MHRNLKPYACCGEQSVILCHVFGKRLEDQYYGVVMCVQWIYLWGHNACTMHQSYESCAKPIQWEHDVCYKQPILWGHDACTEDQSYGTVHVATCTYVQSQVRALCLV